MVVVTQGLLDLGLSKEELEAVIAHEIGHLAHRDNAYAVSTSLTPFLVYIIGVVAVIFGLSVFSAAPRVARSNREGSAGFIGLAMAVIGMFTVVFGLLMAVFSAIVNISVLAFSRIREHLADIYSVDALRSNALASALAKLESRVKEIEVGKRENRVVPELRKMLYIVPAPSGAAVNIFSTHPPTGMRVLVIQARLREIATRT